MSYIKFFKDISKDDVKEVGEGFECGLTIHGFDTIEAGDIVEAFEIEKVARTL